MNKERKVAIAVDAKAAGFEEAKLARIQQLKEELRAVRAQAAAKPDTPEEEQQEEQQQQEEDLAPAPSPPATRASR